jgi:AraC-like DNA-binding protein
MLGEFEFINYTKFKHINIFLVDLKYRTPHFHHHIELGLILSGSVNIKKGELSHLYKEGDVFLLNPREPHELFAVNNNSLLLIIQVSNQLFVSYFPEIRNIQFSEHNLNSVLPFDSFTNMLSLITELATFYFKQDTYFEFQCAIKINELFLLLLESIPYKIISDSEQVIIHKHINRLNRIINYVEDNYNRKLLLREIAENEKLSLNYLSNFIKVHLGMSFQDYLNRLRLEHAIYLLENTDLNLFEISIDSGFSDTRYLNKLFTAKYHCTPKEHRNIYSNTGEKSTQTSASSQHFVPSEEALLLISSSINLDGILPPAQ